MTNHENQKSDLPNEREVVTPLVTLPEYLRKEQLEGLVPDTVVFISSGALVVDTKTAGIYLDATTEITEDDYELPKYIYDKSGRIAVMHIYDETGSHFVVDATGLISGSIRSEKDLFQDDKPEEERYTDATRENHPPLSAVAFRNMEGEIELHGNPKYFDSVRVVVEQFDRSLSQNRDYQFGEPEDDSDLV